MELNYSIKKKIWNVVNCMETGTPYLKYDDITILPDGPNGVREITLSFGLIQKSGDLEKCIRKYIAKKGEYSTSFIPYINGISTDFSLVNDAKFISLLKNSAKYDKKMQDSIDEMFEEDNFNPALKWATTEGFTLPLSILCIFDSFVQSGSIMTFLRNKFSERTPAHGGDEKKWITQYINARHNWMANHSNSAIRASTYRTKTYLKLIEADNWQLNGVITTLNGCKVI